MKKLIIVCFLLLGLGAHSQILNVETSDIIIKSVNSCIYDFIEDTLFRKVIPLKNIVIRPVSINNNGDSLIFSLLMNATPNDLRKINLAGFKHLGFERTLFIQQSHMKKDFTKIEWVTDLKSINQLVDSLSGNAELPWFESQPLIVVCLVYDKTHPGSSDFSRMFYLDAEFYLMRDYLPKEYYPIEGSSQKHILYWNIHSYEFYYNYPIEFRGILSFKKRMVLSYLINW